MNEKTLHEELISLLRKEKSSYAAPVNSEYIGQKLRISPSYVRTQMCCLIKNKQAAVRRGNGGGYYLIEGGKVKMADPILVDKKEMLLDSILYMNQYLERLTTGLKEIAIQLQTGGESKAFEKLPDAVDGMFLMLQLIQTCIAVLNLEPEQVEYCTAAVKLMGEQIEEMNAAIARKDYGTLADQCEYELVEILDEQVKPIWALFCHLVQNKHTV